MHLNYVVSFSAIQTNQRMNTVAYKYISWALVLTIFNEGAYLTVKSIFHKALNRNHTRIRSSNQPVLSNKSKVSCSKKQRGPFDGARTQDLYITSQIARRTSDKYSTYNDCYSYIDSAGWSHTNTSQNTPPQWSNVQFWRTRAKFDDSIYWHIYDKTTDAGLDTIYTLCSDSSTG